MGLSIGGATDPTAAAPLGDSIVMEPTTFERPQDFRAWLEQHHDSEPELWVGYFKKGSGKPSMTWPESVDEALCYGWIDGIVRRVDDQRHVQRFTPRKPSSTWSAINIAKVAKLRAEGRMRPAGEAAFARRSEDKSAIYSYEQRENGKLEAEQEARFRANAPAWEYFQSRPPWYRKVALYWVVSAKRAETRERRLGQLIADSATSRELKQFLRPARSRAPQ
jgi:uncharacterized protein YdeI (YjbR/CyaY-like superfamily)